MFGRPFPPAAARHAGIPAVTLVHDVPDALVLEHCVDVVDAARPRGAVQAATSEHRRDYVELRLVAVDPALGLALAEQALRRGRRHCRC
jgi:hypothetical protein